MQDAAKNMIIGIFVIIAIAIVVFILMFLHPTVGDQGKTLHARFTNIDKINKGTRVTFAGKPVGEVIKIHEVKEARVDQEYRDGEVYIYELTLKIDSGVDVYDTDEISVRTSGLLGEKSVEITPLPIKPNHYPRQVTEKEIIFAASPESLEEAIAAINIVVDKAGKTFDSITEQLQELKEERFIEKIVNVIENVQDITNALNRPQDLVDIIKNAQTFTEGAVNVMDRVSTSWNKVDNILIDVATVVRSFQQFGDKGNVIATNVNQVVDRFHEIVTTVQGGEGTLGKLLVNDDIHLKLDALLSKGHTVMNDINHYGLLFNLDKGWQRLRARRVNLLQKLCTPQEFRNFFEDEVDNISTSLSRVSMVLKETEECCGPWSIINNCEFSKVYAELLQSVTGLEENLKLYNQQVVDIRENCCGAQPQACTENQGNYRSCPHNPPCAR